jgi:hypothetical protein
VADTQGRDFFISYTQVNPTAAVVRRLASGRWLDRLRGSWEDPTKATMRVRLR